MPYNRSFFLMTSWLPSRCKKKTCKPRSYLSTKLFLLDSDCDSLLFLLSSKHCIALCLRNALWQPAAGAIGLISYIRNGIQYILFNWSVQSFLKTGKLENRKQAWLLKGFFHKEFTWNQLTKSMCLVARFETEDYMNGEWSKSADIFSALCYSKQRWLTLFLFINN